MRYTMRALLLGLLVAAALAAGGAAQGDGTTSPQRNARAARPAHTMSPMAQRAHRLVASLN